MARKLPSFDFAAFTARGGMEGLEAEAAKAAALSVDEQWLPELEAALYELEVNPKSNLLALARLAWEVRRLRKRLGPSLEKRQERREKTRERVRRWRERQEAQRA